MIEFLKVTISPAMLPFTILLGAAMLYWLTTIIGVMDLNMFDSLMPEVDADLDLGIEADADVDVNADLGGDADLDGDAHIGGAGHGDVSPMMHFLDYMNIGRVPVSIVGSVFILYLWLFAMVFNLYIRPIFGTALPMSVIMILVSLVLVIGSLVVTGASVRPMRKWFINKTTHGHQHLVGQICRVKTTSVTERVGQGIIEEGGVSLTLSIRCESPNTLRRGSDAVLVSYDKERDAYQVRAMS